MRLIITALLSIVAFWSMPSFAECADEENVNVSVTVDEAAGRVSPKDLEVCSGDVVTWTNTGPSMFHVIFKRGSPPGSPSQRDNEFSVTINDVPGTYVYDVKINGQTLDPTIIIMR